MTQANLETIDRAVHQANAWIDDVQAEAGLLDRGHALSALRAGLHALRDRIGHAHAIALGDQLPLLIRGLYYEAWRLHEPQSRERSTARFLQHVQRDLAPGIEPAHALRAVLSVLARRIDADELAKLENLFPQELQQFWPMPPPPAATIAKL